MYSEGMMSEEMLKSKYNLLAPVLDERSLRLWAAAEACAAGYGGISRVSRATGFSRTTIHAGICELEASPSRPAPKRAGATRRIRRPGGGRKRRKETDPQLLRDLDKLLDPVTRGNPMSPLRWTCKSTTKLAAELRQMGHVVSQSTVWRLLDELGYSMQSNRKGREGASHPDRNAQFEYISESAQEFLARRQPVISVDTKKKELVGPFKNSGREWQKKGEAVEVNIHDFADRRLGKVIPYGAYDIGRNEGWVGVGITHDTAEFAVETIRRWWKTMGSAAYPEAAELLIAADAGGSNGSRVRLWKVGLQRLANELRMTIHVRHFPPGTSKWNKIEHRMFCHITENWRGRPLTSRMAIVHLISNTKTAQGLSIKAALDKATYPTGKKISAAEMKALCVVPCSFHGEWNYSVRPSP
jgi:transposase